MLPYYGPHVLDVSCPAVTRFGGVSVYKQARELMGIMGPLSFYLYYIYIEKPSTSQTLHAHSQILNSKFLHLNYTTENPKEQDPTTRTNTVSPRALDIEPP